MSERLPYVDPSWPSEPEMHEYAEAVCEHLRRWSKGGLSRLQYVLLQSRHLEPGTKYAIVALCRDGDDFPRMSTFGQIGAEYMRALSTAYKVMKGRFEPNCKAFHGSRIYIVKELRPQHWTSEQALADASEIARAVIQGNEYRRANTHTKGD